MIENNLLRALKLLDLLIQYPSEHNFCVSTDKAANPMNILSASKKLMEEMIIAYSDKLPIKAARFANVAFSNGSFPLGFIERLQKKQPWSCPKSIYRFFVSPQELGELCLKADQIALVLLKTLGLEPDFCQSEEESKQKAMQFDETSTSYTIYYFGSDPMAKKLLKSFILNLITIP